MKTFDVLLIYESKVRELESICLLKTELEDRGLKVGVSNTWHAYYYELKKKNAVVTITPSMYHNGIFEFISEISFKPRKILNLQWEQIGTLDDVGKEDSRFNLRGISHRCINICWGERTYQRLKTISKIDEKYLSLTGQISMDFCRPELRGYFLSKEQLFKKYDIPINKKCFLFISSFSYVSLPEKFKNESEIKSIDKFIEFSVSSFSHIVNWISKLLEDNDDAVFIYRPHPAEANSEALSQLKQRFKHRFFIINEESVKQWIITSDKVFTWYSTSFAEAYFLDKKCYVLRPVNVPEKMEVELLEGVKKIKSFNDFLSCIKNDNEDKEIIDSLTSFYDYRPYPSYKRVSDRIVDYLKSDMVLSDEDLTFLNDKGNNSSLKNRVVKMWLKLKNRFILSKYIKNQIKNNYVSKWKIKKVQHKIRICLRNKNENN